MENSPAAFYEIDGWRLALGLVVGATIPVVYNAIGLGPLWLAGLIIGAICAVLIVLLVGLPLLYFLCATRSLNIYLAILIGAILATLPDLLISISGMSGGLQALQVGNERLVGDGHLTGQGWYHFFVRRPLMFFMPSGALGGGVAWLIAFGFRAAPALKAGSQ